MSAVRATPTRRGEPAASRRRFATSRRCDAFLCAAGALWPFVGRTPRSPGAGSNGWPGHDQVVRHPRTLCRLARVRNGNTGITPPRLSLCPFSSGSYASPSGALWPLFLVFPRFSSSSALFALLPFGFPLLTSRVSSSAPLSLTRSRISSSTTSLRNSWDESELLMSKVVVFTNMTLHGVMQAPGRPDEDRRGGFEHGGWATPYAAMVQAGDSMATIGALLLGQRTYEDFYAA